jgi:hypothetical protein
LDSESDWAKFEESKWLPRHGVERVVALLVYIVFLNALCVVLLTIGLLLGGMGPVEFFWPKRWW